ncbi:D-amino acid oxidase [Vanrija albida]|uniref:D-amino acid oxidase n=1 Tax=Vanrija albida TaxID=181172 RepID=A0ABR3PTT7_9TREE
MTASTAGPLAQDEVVVVGAGVIGLTTALILARRGYKVHVVAKNLPEDELDQDWSSPWAGANWCPFSSEERVCRWETESLARLRELIPMGLAMPLPVLRYAATDSGLHNHWYKDVAKNYRRLKPDECPNGGVGVAFESLSVNAPVYLKWIEAQCRALGVTIVRGEVAALSDVIKPTTRVVVNATGLGSLTLTDVRDTAVEPIRGQIVLVRAPKVKRCVMDSSRSNVDPTRSTYIIPRPNSGGVTICGGCYEVGSWERKADPALSRKILEECLAHVPELSVDGTVEGMDVIRECVGFRPSRQGGPRLEREDRAVRGRRVAVVHAYGIGPAGFQASWGMAKEAADLVSEAVLEAEAAVLKARL